MKTCKQCGQSITALKRSTYCSSNCADESLRIQTQEYKKLRAEERKKPKATTPKIVKKNIIPIGTVNNKAISKGVSYGEKVSEDYLQSEEYKGIFELRSFGKRDTQN